MMNCQEVSTIVDRWEAGETIHPSTFAEVEAHIRSCPSCKQRLEGLLPLLRADVSQEVLRFPGVSDFSIADRVMDGILQKGERSSRLSRNSAPKGVYGRHLSPRPFLRPSRIGAFAAAIVAVLVLALGLSRFMVKAAVSAAAADRVTVTFVLEAPQAKSVAVTGNFDNWSDQGIPLRKQGDGKTWEATVTLKRSLEYRYNFVIDGERYISDPRALLSVDDGFGGQVSLLDL